jgi:hypothetical protein
MGDTQRMLEGLKQEALGRAVFAEADAATAAAWAFTYIHEVHANESKPGDWLPVRVVKWFRRRKAQTRADLCFKASEYHAKAAQAYNHAATIAGGPAVLDVEQ